MIVRRLQLAIVCSLQLATVAYLGCGGDDDGATPDASAADASVPDAPKVDSTTVTDSAPAPDSALPDAAADAPVLDAAAEAAVDAAPDATDAADDAAPDGGGSGCAIGVRAGLDAGTYPNVAACTGTWVGHVNDAGALCAAGWHVCNGSEAALNAVQYGEAVLIPGCFAMNAAQDNFVCRVDCAAAVANGVDTEANIDMGAIGAACPFKLGGASCITGGRIDFSENSGTGCNFAAGLTGVICCKN